VSVKLKSVPVAVARGATHCINQDFAAFDLPACGGERYERLAPDTLDLQERAALTVNGLTGPADPEADDEVCWLVFPRTHTASPSTPLPTLGANDIPLGSQGWLRDPHQHAVVQARM
jgi:hypothetical protein